MDFVQETGAAFGPVAAMTMGARADAVVRMETRYKIECLDRDGGLLWRMFCKNRVVTVGLNKLLDATFKSGLTSPAWYVGLCGPSITDGAMTSGSAVLTSASNPFTSADAGRAIIVRGAGSTGNDLVTTILSYTSAGSVTLAASAGTTVSSAAVIFDARAGDIMAAHSPWIESTAYTQSTRPAFTPGTIANGSVDNSASVAVFSINADNTWVGGAFLVDNNAIGGTTGNLYGMAPFGSPGFQKASNGTTVNVTATLSAASQ